MAIPLVEVQTVQASALKTLFECLKEVLHEVPLVFHPVDGISVLQMDFGKSSLVSLTLDAAAFDAYHVTSTVAAGVASETMFRVFKTAGVNDVVTIRMDSADHIKFIITNDTTGKVSTYTVQVCEVDRCHYQAPSEHTFNAVIKIPSREFSRLFRDMKNISDHPKGKTVTIDRLIDKIRLTCTGDAVDQQVEIAYADVDVESPPTVVSGCFSLGHLAMYAKCSSLCAVTTLYMNSDPKFPLIIDYLIASLGKLRIVLAPVDQG